MATPKPTPAAIATAKKLASKAKPKCPECSEPMKDGACTDCGYTAPVK